MKRAAEALGFSVPGGKRTAVASGPVAVVPNTQFCVKMLCNDALVMMILGDMGSRKDSIQKETNTELVLSNKGDYFPGSHFRVLGVFGDDLRSIHDACEFIMNDIVECGVQESGTTDHPDNLGKEPGESIARLAVSKVSGGALIGPGGSNIKAMRQETSCKVFIDNQTMMGHQLVRLIGAPESILLALDRMNDLCQAESGTSDFQSWCELINFDQAAQTKNHPLADRSTAGRGRGREEGGDDHRDGGKGGGKGEKGGGKGEKGPPKSRLCQFFQQGKCKFGDGCHNAHGEEDLRLPDPEIEFETGDSEAMHTGGPSPKSKMCSFFLQGKCKFGSGCRNAHDADELMPAEGSGQLLPPKGKGKGKSKAAEPAAQVQFKPPGGGGALGPSMFEAGPPLGPPGRELGPPLGLSGRERPPSWELGPGGVPFGMPGPGQPLPPGVQPAVDTLREAVESMPEGTQDMAYSITWSLPASHVSPSIGKNGENSQKVERQTGVTVTFGKGTGKGAADTAQGSAVGALYGIYAAHILMVKKSYDIEQRDSDQMRDRQAKERELQEQKRELERKLDMERRAEMMQRQLDARRQENERRARMEEMRKQRELENQQRALEEQLQESQHALEASPQFPPQAPRLSWMVPERSGSSPPPAVDPLRAAVMAGAGEADGHEWAADPNAFDLDDGEAEPEAGDVDIENEILNEWGAAPGDEEPPEGEHAEGEYQEEDGEYQEDGAGDALDGLDPNNQEDLQATLANLQAQLAKVTAMAAAAKAQPAGPGRPKGAAQGKGKGKSKAAKMEGRAGH